MITFSFRPSRRSVLPSRAASVRTLVVSWNDAADRNESVASEAVVMPGMVASLSAALDLVALRDEETRTARERVAVLLAVLERDDDLALLLGVLDRSDAALGRKLGQALRLACLEQLDDTRQTVRDVRAGDAAGV